MARKSTKISTEEQKELLKQNKVIPARLALAIADKKLNQKDFAEELSNRSGLRVISSNVSMWIGGSRSVPEKYLKHISDILGVTIPYLIGLTSDKKVDWNKLNDSTATETYQEDPNKFTELVYADLYAFNKRPVYFRFQNFEHPDGWAIYNRDKEQFIFAEDVVKEVTIRNWKGVKIYTNNTEPSEDPLEARESLDFSYFMKLDRVYIHMNSSHPEIHALYDGWYRHNENRTALINDEGNVLPYSGFKKNYRAYGYRYMNQKTRTFTDN